MPIYLYETLATGETFEHLQGLHDAPLTEHPETGRAVRRVVAAPGPVPQAGARAHLDDRNLARRGFTRYEKAAAGHYVKTAGDPAAPRELRG
jgi:putative FmdB family regulatory protein